MLEHSETADNRMACIHANDTTAQNQHPPSACHSRGPNVSFTVCKAPGWLQLKIGLFLTVLLALLRLLGFL